MSVALIMCIFYGIFVFFMGLQGNRAAWKRVIPLSYKITYVILYVCYCVLSVCLARKVIPDTTSIIEIFEVSIMLALVLTAIFAIPTVLISSEGTYREIGFKATLLYGFAKKEDKEYLKLTSREFAEDNHIDYIENINGNIIENDEEINRSVAKENKYIAFYPYNDGYRYSPKKEWFGKFSRADGTPYYAMIMDTKKSFENITNLKDIIMQIIDLYWENMNNEVYIDPYGFALMLEETPSEGYVGTARLFVTADTIKNSKIEIDEKGKYKRYYINKFLDHFICWNFGKVISENVDLQVRLMQLNEYAILKGLRKPAGPGCKVHFDDHIKPFNLKVYKN